ncbi:MAG: hypothetical protein K5920_02095 [Bacteroidales bacterium]|nr:hypothetical protein [Bacteroidales bacterium]
MKNRKLRFGTLLVFLAAMFFSMTSCDYFVEVGFNIESPENDTIDFNGWQGTGVVNMTTPYTNQSGQEWEQTMDQITVSMFGVMGGRSVAISEEQAFAKLMSDFDSVKIIRRSDGASTITYRHDENATDEQRYFFTREAWKCDPEGETEKDRIYTLILTEEMFR